MLETRVQSLGWEDLLEKEMAPHSTILAWKIPRMEEPGRLHSPWSRKESDKTERLHFHIEPLLCRFWLGDSRLPVGWSLNMSKRLSLHEELRSYSIRASVEHWLLGNCFLSDLLSGSPSCQSLLWPTDPFTALTSPCAPFLCCFTHNGDDFHTVCSVSSSLFL